MPTLRRITVLAAFCAAALWATPALLSAEETAGQSAPAAEGKAPCPYSEGGNCCATCQDKAKLAAQAAPAAAAEPAEVHGDCPCKRAAQLKAKAKAQP